jgi:hypothetical protein
MEALIFLSICLVIVVAVDINQKRRAFITKGRNEY